MQHDIINALSLLLLIGAAVIMFSLVHLHSDKPTTRDEFIAIINAALTDGDKSAHELVKYIRAHNLELWQRGTGQLYHILALLEDNKKISSRIEIDPMSNRWRRYYSLPKENSK